MQRISVAEQVELRPSNGNQPVDSARLAELRQAVAQMRRDLESAQLKAVRSDDAALHVICR